MLGLIAALAIIALRVDALVRERAGILQQRQEQAATLAQFAATFSARLYDQSERVAADVVGRLESGAISDAALHEYLRLRAADTTADEYIVVLDRKGGVRATSEAGARPTMTFGGPEFEKRWADDDQRVSQVLRSRLTGAVIYPFAQRVEDRSGAFAGVVSVNVRPENIRPSARRRPQDPLLTLWTQEGGFIAANFVDFDRGGTAQAPAKPAELGVPGSADDPDPKAISASAPVQGWPLVAAASFDKAGVLAEWRQHVLETVILIVLSVLGLGVLVWLGMRTADREDDAKRRLQEASAVAAQALDERDLLLKEVHHRMKNSLQMAASLIYLQERRFNDPEVREAFESTRRRLNSISLVHEALYSGSSLQEVDLSIYLARLVDEMAEAYGAAARGVTVTTEAEPVPLAAEKATPVGLIVTEVVTNALKHAFEEGAEGTIRVRVHRYGVDEVEVEVRDDGRGYPLGTTATREGLGTRVVSVLAEQLRGRVSHASDGGAVFRLVFPR